MLKQHSEEQWKHICHSVELLPIVKVYLKLFNLLDPDVFKLGFPRHQVFKSKMFCAQLVAKNDLIFQMIWQKKSQNNLEET